MSKKQIAVANSSEILFSIGNKAISDALSVVNSVKDLRPETSSEYSKVTKVNSMVKGIRKTLSVEGKEKKDSNIEHAKLENTKIDTASDLIDVQLIKLQASLDPSLSFYREKQANKKAEKEAIEKANDIITSNFNSLKEMSNAIYHMDSESLSNAYTELSDSDINDESFGGRISSALALKESTLAAIQSRIAEVLLAEKSASDSEVISYLSSVQGLARQCVFDSDKEGISSIRSHIEFIKSEKLNDMGALKMAGEALYDSALGALGDAFDAIESKIKQGEVDSIEDEKEYNKQVEKDREAISKMIKGFNIAVVSTDEASNLMIKLEDAFYDLANF